jgi:hypothetical protein
MIMWSEDLDVLFLSTQIHELMISEWSKVAQEKNLSRVLVQNLQ